jgi:hypothetical protein
VTTVEAFVRVTSATELPKWVLEEIAWLPHGFSGNVQINFLEGGVTNVNFVWSKRKPK